MVRFPVFAATALAGLGDLPGTLMTRSVVIRMRRRACHERVEPFRERTARQHLHPLRDRLATWTTQVATTLSTVYPKLPEKVTDRPADVWEPLVAVADAAGGAWPARAWAACVELVGAAMDSAASLGIRLLTDLRTVFAGEDDLPTATILNRLHALPEAPWADLRGKPLDARGLAHRLGQYGVKSRNLGVGPRAENRVAKGYTAADLHDPWSRYVPTEDLADAFAETTPLSTPAEALPALTPLTPRSEGMITLADEGLLADASASTPGAASTDTPAELPVSVVSAASAPTGGTDASTIAQPTFNTTPDDGLPPGWTQLTYSGPCVGCGGDASTADPRDRFAHPGCASATQPLSEGT